MLSSRLALSSLVNHAAGLPVRWPVRFIGDCQRRPGAPNFCVPPGTLGGLHSFGVGRGQGGAGKNGATGCWRGVAVTLGGGKFVRVRRSFLDEKTRHWTEGRSLFVLAYLPFSRQSTSPRIDEKLLIAHNN